MKKLIPVAMVSILALILCACGRDVKKEVKNGVENYYKTVFLPNHQTITLKKFVVKKIIEEKNTPMVLVTGYWIMDEKSGAYVVQDGRMYVRVQMKKINPSGMLIENALEFKVPKEGFKEDDFIIKAFWENEKKDFERIVYGDVTK